MCMPFEIQPKIIVKGMARMRQMINNGDKAIKAVIIIMITIVRKNDRTAATSTSATEMTPVIMAPARQTSANAQVESGKLVTAQ